ncbi:MAG: hypothetical protein JNM43_23720 [Planctomycetaceae bacterium]|nr:hypothetical protein [Planctomycetaceae bacterium]
MRRRLFLAGSAAALLSSDTLHALAGNLSAAVANDEQSSEDPQKTAAGNETDSVAGPPKGPWRRLMLDAAAVEASEGLHRVFHQATKRAEPVIVADRPWEGTSAITGPYVYGTVLREGDRFRLWYQVLNEGNHVGYAESSDGVRWTKPELDVVKYQGDQKTNLVVSAFAPERSSGVHCHNPSVIRCPDSLGPNRRFALYGFDGNSKGPRVAFSADGIHWDYAWDAQNSKSANPLFSSSDVVSFFYDPYENRMCSTWKTRNRRGRAVGVALSSDGLQWKKVLDGPVFVADDHDPDETQIYGMPVFPYQGLYVGLPWIYSARYFRYGEYSVDKLHEAQRDSPRTMDVQLAWSWDLINWTRPIQRQPLIPRGTSDDWDRGMIVTARAPIVVGDELWFYYGGTDKVHDEPRVKAAIGLATMRLDGFCSMSTRAAGHAGEATESKEGWLVTRREPFRTPKVMINGRTWNDGEIRAEILDRKGRVIPGFSKAECVPFQGDSVRFELHWERVEFPPEHQKKDYRIRFMLKNAELFSWLPANLDPDEPDLARFPEAGP